MDRLFQPSKVTSSDRGIVVGSDADQTSTACAAMPVVREQAPQNRHGAVSIVVPAPMPAPAPAVPEAAAKRSRDAETGDAGPPTKRMRTNGTSSAEETAAVPLQAETGLTAMPDDVLTLIVAALHIPEPVSDVRHLEWLRASCKDLRNRVAAPLPAVVLDLKYQASEKAIGAAISNKQLDGLQVQAQVRALCDRYGDVHVSLRKRTSLLPPSPDLRSRHLSALAGIA